MVEITKLSDGHAKGYRYLRNWSNNRFVNISTLVKQEPLTKKERRRLRKLSNKRNHLDKVAKQAKEVEASRFVTEYRLIKGEK